MANLRFRKGLHATMPSDISEGSIYVATDEKAMYVDISSTERIRLGQIITYATYADFRELAKPPYSTEAFYYIADENALLKWVLKKNSTTEYEWKQINNISDITVDIADLKSDVGDLKTDTANLAKQINVVTYGQETKPEGATDAGVDLNLNSLKTAVVTAQAQADKGVTDAATAQAQANKGVTDAATAQAAANTAQGTADEALEKATANTASIGSLSSEINGTDGIKSRLTQAETDIDNNATAAAGALSAAQAAQGTANQAVSDAAAAQSTANAANSQATQNKTDIANLTTTVANNKTAAENDATSKANTAEANAKAYADQEIAKKIQAADAMVFKGTLDSTHGLPISDVSIGDTYKVAEEGIYNEQSAYVGDLFIAQGTETNGVITSGLTWAYVPSGYVADYNPHLTAGAPSTANNKTDIQNAIHLTSGSAAANTYGDLGIVEVSSTNNNLVVNVTNTSASKAKVEFNLVWEDWN